MVLYKYLRREHADLLLQKGQLRIGTLFEYRDIEQHGTTIGDEGEGKKSLYMPVDNESWTPRTQPDFAKQFFNLGLNGSLTIQGITLETAHESPNYFLFCATEQFDKNALLDFGYDTCVVIERPKKFFAAISKTIRHHAKFKGIFRCRYEERRILHNEDRGTHPAIIKDPSYSNQKEVRALWQPLKRTVRPWVIECREAIKYCSLHARF